MAVQSIVCVVMAVQSIVCVVTGCAVTINGAMAVQCHYYRLCCNGCVAVAVQLPLL